MKTDSSSMFSSSEIELSKLFQLLWKKRWIVIGSCLAATLIGLVYAFVSPNMYRSEALLTASSTDSPGGIDSLAGQYGGLASLAGINLGQQSGDKVVLGIETLQSRKFLTEFIKRHEVLVPLFAAGRWDESKKLLSIDSDIYDVDQKKWVRKVRKPRKQQPSLQEAHEEILKLLTVEKDPETGMIVIAIKHRSPELAKHWVESLVSDLNSVTMSQDVAEAEQAVEFLKSQVAATPVAELQRVFYSLIEEQTKTILLARIRNEYLLKTVDPAVVPEEAFAPNRVVIIVLSFLLGLILSVSSILLHNIAIRSNQD